MTTFLPPSEQLLAFKVSVDRGSFTAAAGQLGVSQSAVSHQIARLERSIGVRLLTRSARGLALTDAGEALLATIDEPLARLVAAFADYEGPLGRGTLKIQVESAFGAAWLSPRLDGFLRQFPALQLQQNRASNLRLTEDIELAVKWGNGRWPKLQSELLMKVEYTPVCAPRLSISGGLSSVGDLENQTLLHDRIYRDWHDWLDMVGVRRPRRKRGHLVDDTYILIQMAIEGRGVALCAPQLLERELANGSLVLPFPDLRLAVEEGYYVLTRKGHQLTRPARVFVEWLRAEVDRDAAGQVAR